MKERIDPYTKESFIPKRSNQLFANRQNQIAFNNEKAKHLRDESREINFKLKKNLKILKRILNDKGTKTVSRDFLDGAEFTFGVFHQEYMHEGRKFCVINKLGYFLMADNSYLIKNFNNF